MFKLRKMGLRTVDFLFLPVRAAFGAAALIGTATLASRAGLSQRAIAASGFSAFGVSQMIFEYLNDIIARTKERSNKEKLAELELSGVMAWNEAIGAIRKMLEMFSDGLVTPFKLKRMLVDVDVLRRHHTTSYEEKRRMAWEETCEDDLESALIFVQRFHMHSIAQFLVCCNIADSYVRCFCIVAWISSSLLLFIFSFWLFFVPA